MWTEVYLVCGFGQAHLGHNARMIDRVKSLEQQVAKLEESELKRFASWFAAYQDKLWDRQIARDGKAGKLDFLIEEARAEKNVGGLKEI